ncbi:uncharacterized protein LOC142532040 [Primulina tabacum]|uniref:uncharacterized protein LOC142532040 n=1 Tax=Primulina tabacum TaxID=48773 RepID=UPI003F5987A0
MASEGSHDSRILIVASGGKFLPDSHAVSAFITDKFAEKQCMGSHTWRYVDAATKAYYWGEFVKSYHWRPDHDAHIRATWKTLAADQYRKTLCSWHTKPKLPLGVNIQIWNKWKEIWSSSQWQNKSEKAKTNRNTEPEGPGIGVIKHIGGSRCFIQHSIKMREDLSRDASAYELFKMMHQKKDGTWVDARSKALDAQMNARFLEASQLDADCESPQNPTPKVQNELYILAVGGVKKRKLYGVGSQAEVLYPEAISGRATHTRANSMDVAAPKAEDAAATSKVEELRRDLTSLRQQVRYLMEHALIDPQSISSSSARDYDDDSTQP